MSDRYFIPVPKLNTSDIKRFWSHVDKSPGQGPKGKCWTWTGALDKVGYARMRMGDDLIYVHRIGFTLQFGKIPKGKRVLHKCDNYSCVRCLYAGTQLDNMRDCRERKRNNKARGSKHGGAKLTEHEVKAIRKMAGTTSEIATLFDTCQTNVSLIKQRKAWTHI